MAAEQPPFLLAVPNVSEGTDAAVLERIERGFGPARFLDLHTDPDHGRAVFTLAARQGELAQGLVGGVAAASEAIDLNAHEGLHPHVGALDVMPVVYHEPEQQGAAGAEVIAAAARVGAELEIPVILYGELATAPDHRERADLRRGGREELARRIEAGAVVPDFGPPRAHPTAGVVLAAARPPLVAFNVDLVSEDVELAKAIAADLREAGGGLPGVRAIGLSLSVRGCAQVSTNVHDPFATPLAEIVAFVGRRAEIAAAELVGLAPRDAFEGFPAEVAIRGFTPERHLLENALRSLR